MSIEGRFMLRGGSVPQPYRFVDTSTGKCFAVRSESYGTYPIRMPRKQSDRGSGMYVIEPDTDGTCYGKLGAIWRMGYVKDSTFTKARFGTVW